MIFPFKNYQGEIKVKWILPILLMSNLVFAHLDKAPQSFKTKFGQAIFADFQTVDTSIIYDLDNKKVMAETKITLETNKAGQILFDLVPNVINAKLNDLEVKIVEVSSPDNSTKYKMVHKTVPAGIHTLFIKNEISKNIDYAWWGKSVSSAFWMTDLQDRSYLERYLPTNIEFDQFQMNLELELIGNNIEEHKVYTNGNVSELSVNKFKINYPAYYTASSIFFHLTKKDRFSENSYDFTSISGRTFKVQVYSSSDSNVSRAVSSSKKVLKELESKLGPWPHENLIIYVAGSGGMEYCGATITSLRALGHELTHSYFARGVMPINGNAGWMDEAIASWRDNGYKSISSPGFSSTRMSGHSDYRRFTDRKAYSQGANFMAYLNHELKAQGGLINFLNEYHKQYSHHNVTTTTFIKELRNFSGRDFTPEFNRYIFGKGSSIKENLEKEHNPFHPILSESQEKELL